MTNALKKILIGFFGIWLFCFCIIGCVIIISSNSESAPKIVREYDVISVCQYVKVNRQNCFGEVLDQKLCYSFTYIGDDGQLHQFDDFEHTEYGTHKVCIGDENKYIVEQCSIDTYRFLYLTEETLKNISYNRNI